MRVFSSVALASILCCSYLSAVAQQDPVVRVGASASAAGQDEVARIVPNFCAWLPSGIPHFEALPGVCEYVMGVAEKMPNFICHQEASRYRGKSRAPHDLITATVRYEDGKESYGEIKVNGRPATMQTAQSTGLWSTGEFGSSNLRSIFSLRNQAVFEFARESVSGTHTAWVFTYHIVKQNEPLWRLHTANEVVAPPYEGELWIDQKTGEVLRFESTAKEFPASFPLTRASLQIDYENIAFADGSVFVLPTSFGASTTFADGESTRNVVRLTDCHKFRARGRLVLEAESGTSGTGPAAQVPASAAFLQKDSDESEAIFAAIRDQALQENATQFEAEQRQALDAVSASTLQKLSELRGEQRRIQSQRQAIAPANVENTVAGADSASRTTLRVNVRLVPVSVVLRDGTGHAVGNMGQDNFRLFDEGRPQVITQFSVETSALRMPPKQIGEAAHAQGQGAVQAETNPSPVAAGERATAYLFDDVHLSFQEIAGARDAAARHLGALKAGERAAVFTTSGAVVVDFTEDGEKLLASLRQLKPHAMLPESDCPPISYYMADLMLNKSDAEATSVAVAEAADCATRGNFPGPHAKHVAAAKALEVLSTGNVESKNALTILFSVIRRTESMPGQRSIVLVSPGFLAPTADMQQDMMAIVDGAARSGIVINTLDAGGLYGGGAAGRVGDPVFDTAEAEARSDVMAEFASGTGGIFFHNNNDLDEGFRRTADAPEFLYVLGFSPQKLDGGFHKLKVTLNAAGRYEVQARRGYYAFKAASAN
jgi:VWFA-related protein